MGVITVSREFGSGGETVAQLVAEKLGFILVNRKMIARGLRDFGVDEQERLLDEKKGPCVDAGAYRSYTTALHDFIYDLAIRHSLVILGRGGHLLFRDYPPSLHVRIIAPPEHRVRRIMRLYDLGVETAQRLISEQDRNKQRYFHDVFNAAWNDLRIYDLVINTGLITLEDAAEIVIGAFRLHGEPRRMAPGAINSDNEETVAPFQPDKGQSFMHESEAEFARMLDFYRIRWEYEPKTFVLEWDSEGNVVEAFAPDFYLPFQDIYVELTTQKPKLAWKKNKKIRRLQELYPDVRIKLINKQGFKSLLLKHSIGGENEEG